MITEIQLHMVFIPLERRLKVASKVSSKVLGNRRRYRKDQLQRHKRHTAPEEVELILFWSQELPKIAV